MGGFSFGFPGNDWTENIPGSSGGFDWGSILKPVATVGAGLLGNLIAGGSSSQYKKAQDKALASLSDASDFGLSQAKTDLPAGKALLQLPISYYQKLLSGDPAQVMDAVGPDVSTVSSQYQAGRKAASEFAPRSGGRAQALEDSRYQEMGKVQDLIRRARAGAPDALTQLAQVLSGIGLSEMSGSNAAMGAAGSLATNARGQSAQQASQLGSGFADILTAILFPKGK